MLSALNKYGIFLSIPLTTFKIIEPDKKLIPALYTWEYNGKICKNYDEYRNKYIEDQVSKRIYQADLKAKQGENRINALSTELEQQIRKNRLLSIELEKLRKILFEASFSDIEKLRDQRQKVLEQKNTRENGFHM